jgi:hypothetical protein
MHFPLQREYWIKEGSAEKGRLLVSPREFSSKPDEVAFVEDGLSDDGTILAFAVNNQGPRFEWRTVHFCSPLKLNFENVVFDTLRKVKYTTLAFTKDNQGIFYAVTGSSEYSHL